MILILLISFFFFFNDTATTEIYTLSLHDALPIFNNAKSLDSAKIRDAIKNINLPATPFGAIKFDVLRSEEHTSELQSHSDLVCRLLLEKKKKKINLP